MTRSAVLKHAKHAEAIAGLSTLSDFWLGLFDVVGASLTEADAVEEKLVTAQSARVHVALVDDLLRGVIPRNTEAQRICARVMSAPASAWRWSSVAWSLWTKRKLISR